MKLFRWIWRLFKRRKPEIINLTDAPTVEVDRVETHGDNTYTVHLKDKLEPGKDYTIDLNDIINRK